MLGIKSLVLAFTLNVLTRGTVAEASRLTERPLNLLPEDNLGEKAYKPRHLAGYFKLDRTYAAQMFYFFFEHRSEADGPLILWMTGGPGCSSELAVFYENGPYTINDDLSLRPNKYGWDAAGSIIYVDQPVNTGFSFSEDERDRVYDERVVAADMLDFFDAFLEAHPEFKGRDLYITGESYAGHYVPAVSYAIHRRNVETNSSDLALKGLAIGNGLTDPAIQYGAYASYAVQHGLISKTVKSAMLSVYPICKFGIDTCNSIGGDLICRSALQFCQFTQFAPILALAGNINVYDVRKPCIGQLCYDFSLLDKYINQPEVRAELGVGDREWQSCNFDVNFDMQGDWMKTYDNLISPLLESDISVMIYAGVEDLICNWVGNERWVNALPWSNASKFAVAREKVWTIDGKDVGSVRSAGRLSFIKVKDAGHMSPMDQPESTLNMIKHFVQGKPLNVTGLWTPIEKGTDHLSKVRPLRFVESVN